MLKRLLPAVLVFSLLGSLCAAQIFTSEAGSQPARKVPIRRIIFQNALLLSPADRQEISRALRDENVAANPSQWDPSGMADEAADLVRAAYQNHGYFKAQVDAKTVPVGAGIAATYDVVVQALEEGRRYRLGDLRVVDMKAFPESRLRDLFPIQRGVIFSRETIAGGLENLRRLYGSEGYVNFAAVPNTEFDETQASINLLVDIDEGASFPLGQPPCVRNA